MAWEDSNAASMPESYDSRPTEGSKNSLNNLRGAIQNHGANSPQANRAIRDAIGSGWNFEGIAERINLPNSWPSGGAGGGRRSAGETRRAIGRGGSGRRGSGGSRGGGGIAGPKSPRVDQ
jgi:hypothetical protein